MLSVGKIIKFCAKNINDILFTSTKDPGEKGCGKVFAAFLIFWS